VFTKKELEFIRLLSSCNAVLIQRLPVNASVIPLVLLLQTLDADANGREVSVKQLFSSVPFSEMGVRVHFRRLIHQGWIEITAHPGDSRCKLVKASRRLIETFNKTVADFPNVSVAQTSSILPSLSLATIVCGFFVD